jgi:Ca-activated chloride channel family protein
VSLAHPEWLPVLFLALILAAAVVTVSWGFARRRARRLLGPEHPVGGRRLARDLALVGAAAALAAAWLGPRIGERTVRVPASGVDVVILLDVSRSMEAADVPPSRLVRGRALARELLLRLGSGDRAALAAFAGRGVLLTPLTPDTDALSDLLEGLDPDLIAERGSDLGSGVGAALAAFESGSERPRIVAVLTDGEDPGRLGDAGAPEALRRAQARLVAIGLGSATGAPVPDDRRPLRDASGRPVVSRLDAERLARWCAASDGAFFAADRWGDVDLAAVLASVRRDTGRAEGELVERRMPATRVVPFAALAFGLLWLEWVGLRSARRPLAALALAAIASTLLVLPGGASDLVRSLEARLRARPGDPGLLVALGVARAESGAPEEAAHALRAAALSARDPRIASLAYYDLGVLALEERDLPAARDAFLDALALDPEDREARFNLEWTLRALEASPPPPLGSSPDPKEEPPVDERPTPRSDERADADEGVPPRPAPVPDPGVRQQAPHLEPEEVERWLEAVDDSAGRALHPVARDSSGAGRRPWLPPW